MENNEQKYADIFYLPRPTSLKRPRMSRIDRAAQFAPFAALTGHDDAIKETARLTDERVELDELAKEQLDEKLHMALDLSDTEPSVTVTYFVPDPQKSGGTYVDHTGVIKRIDTLKRTVVFADKTAIPIDAIYTIEGALFNSFER